MTGGASGSSCIDLRLNFVGFESVPVKPVTFEGHLDLRRLCGLVQQCTPLGAERKACMSWKSSVLMFLFEARERIDGAHSRSTYEL